MQSLYSFCMQFFFFYNFHNNNFNFDDKLVQRSARYLHKAAYKLVSVESQ